MENRKSAPASAPEITFPFDVSFVDCPPSAAIRFQVEEHLGKLSQIYPRITDCKVVIRIAHRHGHEHPIHVNIQLDVPGKRLAVSREPVERESTKDSHLAVRDAFHKMTRQLEDFSQLRDRHS